MYFILRFYNLAAIKFIRHYIIIFGRFFFFLRLLRWPKIIGGGMGAAENKNKRRLKIKAVSKDVAENNQPRYLFYLPLFLGKRKNKGNIFIIGGGH